MCQKKKIFSFKFFVLKWDFFCKLNFGCEKKIIFLVRKFFLSDQKRKIFFCSENKNFFDQKKEKKNFFQIKIKLFIDPNFNLPKKTHYKKSNGPDFTSWEIVKNVFSYFGDSKSRKVWETDKVMIKCCADINGARGVTLARAWTCI